MHISAIITNAIAAPVAASAPLAAPESAAAATTASTVAAGALIGSATVYGTAVIAASITSDSIDEFNEKGTGEQLRQPPADLFRAQSADM